MTDGNENIMHVVAIEGLLSQVNDHLGKISDDKRTVKSKAIEEIDLFQKTTLYELRLLCEGD
jgi:hypothetical protein